MRPKPSDYYKYISRSEASSIIKENGYKVIAFRPPRVGEKFLNTSGEVDNAVINFVGWRLILAPV